MLFLLMSTETYPLLIQIEYFKTVRPSICMSSLHLQYNTDDVSSCGGV